jgi:RNA polymerase sigma factor (sigma-70 family)
MTSDSELLSCYAESGSEEAFGELVRRHLDLVYSAALRQVNGDTHLAQDVTQKVFSELVRKASALSRRPAVTGWLYTTAHFIATKAVRTECRRRKYEQEAQAMQNLLQNTSNDPNWDKLRPILDQVMHDLKPADREAILMRYFENRQLAEVGERLGLSEDAARKRVDRALEKLRSYLARRGITTSATLATLLSANAVQLAPTGLAATLTSASLVSAAAAGGTTITLLKIITMTKLQAGIIGAVVLAGAATTLVVRQSALGNENKTLLQRVDQLAQLQLENERLSNLVAKANGSQRPASTELDELLRLRAEANDLRRQTNEIARLQAENQRLRTSVAKVAGSKAGDTTASVQENLPKESWAFVGYAEPESAFQSCVWAMNSGDAKTFLASLSPQGMERHNVKGKSEEEIAKENKEEFQDVTGFKIVDKSVISDNEVVLTVYASGINNTTRFKFQRIGSDWKNAGPAHGPSQSAAK